MSFQYLDFRTIRPYAGSQHSGFEELCCQLAALESSGRPFQRKGPGADAGVECYRVEVSGSETCWQAKYFFEFGSSQISQITESFEHALELHPKLQKYIVCLPINFSDGRVGNQKSQKQRWNDCVANCAKAAAPRKVEIELWGAFEIVERLGRDDPLYSGRRAFWFGGTQFGSDWFKSRFDVARAALGERYAPQLNIELPIRRALAAFIRDPKFIKEVEDWADRIDETFNRAIDYLRNQVTGSSASSVARLEAEVPPLVRNIRLAPKGPADLLPIERWCSALSKAAAALEECGMALWNGSREVESKRDRDAALHFTSLLRDVIEDVATEMQSQSTALSNTRRLLIEGEAGVGKSHLLADVADNHIANGRPAVMILGGMFSDADTWSQVLAHFGLASTLPDDFLGALDAAAEAAGTRAIIIIDAINERQGVAVWSHRLAGFLQTAVRFPRVAIVVSCRTTFLPWIVDSQLGVADLPRITHPGFAGRAAEASRRYLDQRGIVRMAAPALAPEFENPLFLRTCCDLLQRQGEVELPRGLSGVTAIFDFYFGAVAETITLRMHLNPRLKIVERALGVLTTRMVKDGTGYIALDDVIALLEFIHPSHGQNEQTLLFQLESEGVISVEPVELVDGVQEQVRFTFERLSDHRIAARLLDDHVGDGDLALAFAEGGPLEGHLQGPDSYQRAGIVEAFAVQLPERYGIELPDVVQSVGARWRLWHPFELSLLWRKQETFTKRTLELVSELAPECGFNPVLAALVAIATEPNNSFNAEHLDHRLRAMQMPDRDKLWSISISQLAEHQGNPVETLIEWTLANAFHPIELARARLVAITLCWLFSLSHRAVRDRATKALAALLVTRRNLAAELIRLFADIDDAYILDRVLAAAYGGALRSHSDENLTDLAAAAYDAVFARDPISDHALVRDHARGIVELAAYRNALPTGLDPKRARPPYQARRSVEQIGADVIEQFKEDLGRGKLHDSIYYSAIMDGDFARYVIDKVAEQFLQLPIEEVGRTPKQIFDRWHRKVIAPHTERVEALDRLLQVSRNLYELPHEWDFSSVLLTSAASEEERKQLETEREEAENKLKMLLGEDGTREFRIRAAGYVREGAWHKKGNVWCPTLEGEQARRWVAWRAHDLGWTPERFSEFDHKLPDSGRMEHRIERIGKKYQWIALYELVGRLSDCFAVGRGWQEKTGVYQGPWDISIREMDPSILVTRTPNRERNEQSSTWWAPHAPRWKVEPPTARRAWMADRERDIPDPVKQIDVSDREGQRWLVLDISMSRNQWHMVDGERTAHRMTWHKIKCLLVPVANRARLLRLLASSMRDRDHPPEVDLSSDAYLGEYAWHPSCADASGSWKLGPARGRPIPVHNLVVDRYTERSGHDYSIEDSFNLTIPAPLLMAGLNLRLAEGRSLAFIGTGGKIVFKDPSTEEPGYSAAVIDRETFTDFLRREGLEAVWIITGEKSAHGGPTRGEGWGGQLEYWGLYTMDGKTLSGDITFEQTEPRPSQLDTFLAGD